MSPKGRPWIFGEVLFDRFPDGSEVLGGAPFNVAWNLRGLGLNPLLLSRVGADPLGDRILAAMDAFGLDSSGIQRDAAHPTGTVEVELRDGEPRFDIVADRAYDYIAATDRVAESGHATADPGMIYHGSLALRGRQSSETIHRLVAQEQTREDPAEVFFDVNLRSPWWDHARLEGWIQGADHLKLNEDELESVVPEAGSIAERARDLLSRTRVQSLFVTRGARGARAFTAAGEESDTRASAEVSVVDTVGAGDAFASVLMVGILSDWPLQTALQRAREFAEAVVGIRGATTLDPDFYSRVRASWSDA